MATHLDNGIGILNSLSSNGTQDQPADESALFMTLYYYQHLISLFDSDDEYQHHHEIIGQLQQNWGQDLNNIVQELWHLAEPEHTVDYSNDNQEENLETTYQPVESTQQSLWGKNSTDFPQKRKDNCQE